MISVSEINLTIKACMDASIFKGLEVFGEISNYKISGAHAYFVLKDDSAQIACCCFNASKTYIPKDGESVIIKGSLDYYVKGGKLSLNASSITPVGQGLLFLQFERLKEKLLKEGLFEIEHKKAIPAYVKNICVVTSKSGAVIRDIVTTVRRKNPVINIVVKDVRVQGEGAAKEICTALKRIDSLGYDAVILARGGGSLEDLASFYDEQLVRTIYSLQTPIISAVGHETDFSLADFAADARAATPTAAAELVAYDYYALYDSVILNADRMAQYAAKLYDKKAMRSRLACQQLTASASKFYAAKMNGVGILTMRMQNIIGKKIDGFEHRLERAADSLDNLSPVKTLKRGYFGIKSKGRQITKVSELSVGDDITASGSDGNLTATVNKIEMNINAAEREYNQ